MTTRNRYEVNSEQVRYEPRLYWLIDTASGKDVPASIFSATTNKRKAIEFCLTMNAEQHDEDRANRA